MATRGFSGDQLEKTTARIQPLIRKPGTMGPKQIFGAAARGSVTRILDKILGRDLTMEARHQPPGGVKRRRLEDY